VRKIEEAMQKIGILANYTMSKTAKSEYMHDGAVKPEEPA
jgi:hypothetical protein